MDRQRLIGLIMIALVFVIIVMVFFGGKNEEQLENENAELRTLLENERENNDASDEETQADNQTENDVDESTPANNQSSDASELLANEITTYDEFMEDFVTTLNIYDNQEQKNETLLSMTNTQAQNYLKENYFILEDGEQVAADEDDEDSEEEHTHAEGGFEPLEMEMELNTMQSYYTYSNNQVEVVSLYRVDTEANDENFSGNYIFKGTLSNDNGNIMIDSIDSIIAISDPNANDLYDNLEE